LHSINEVLRHRQRQDEDQIDHEQCADSHRCCSCCAVA
jgi:hypothetical protein